MSTLSMTRAQRILSRALVCGASALVYVAAPLAQDQSAYSNVILLDQGWSEKDRLRHSCLMVAGKASGWDWVAPRAITDKSNAREQRSAFLAVYYEFGVQA